MPDLLYLDETFRSFYDPIELLPPSPEEPNVGFQSGLNIICTYPRFGFKATRVCSGPADQIASVEINTIICILETAGRVILDPPAKYTFGKDGSCILYTQILSLFIHPQRAQTKYHLDPPPAEVNSCEGEDQSHLNDPEGTLGWYRCTIGLEVVVCQEGARISEQDDPLGIMEKFFPKEPSRQEPSRPEPSRAESSRPEE